MSPRNENNERLPLDKHALPKGDKYKIRVPGKYLVTNESMLPATKDNHAPMVRHNTSYPLLMSDSAELHETAHGPGRKRAQEHDCSYIVLIWEKQRRSRMA